MSILSLKNLCRSMLFVLLLYVKVANAKTFNEQVYEEIYSKHCSEASYSEIKFLSCITTGVVSNTKDLDKMSEQLVFSDISKCESSKLNCLQNEIKNILSSDEIKIKLLSTTCNRLTKLRESYQNIQLMDNWIASYSKINDPLFRNISKEEFNSNSQVIEELKKRKMLYQYHISVLQAHDPLLSSPSFFQKVNDLLASDFLIRAKSDTEICASLDKELPSILEKDLKDLEQSTKLIEKNLKNAHWLTDDNFKRQLWNSSCSNEFTQKLKQVSDLSGSTLCRMESRYGIGAVHGDKLKNIASLGLGIGVAGAGRIAGLLAAKKLKTAYSLASATALTEFVVGAGVTGYQISQACKEKMNATTNKSSCQASDQSEFKNLYYEKQDMNECLIAGTTGIIFSGLSALGAKSVIKGARYEKLQAELQAKETRLNLLAEKRENFLQGYKVNIPPHLSSSNNLSLKDLEEIFKNNGIKTATTPDGKLKILPDSSSNHSLAKAATAIDKDGYSLIITEDLKFPFSFKAYVDPRLKTLNLRANDAVKLDNPKQTEILFHELRHVTESSRSQPASKIQLSVVNPGPMDAVYIGRYGSKMNFSLEEPFSFYQGGSIASALTGGSDRAQLYQSFLMTQRLNQIFRTVKFDKNEFLYNKSTGEYFLKLDSKIPYTRIKDGRYTLRIEVGKNLSPQEAEKAAKDIFESYLEKLKRVDESTQKALEKTDSSFFQKLFRKSIQSL